MPSLLSLEKESCTPRYAPLALNEDTQSSNASLDTRTSAEVNHSASLLDASDGPHTLAPSGHYYMILYFSFALALLSATNIALFPAVLSKYRAHPFSDSELEALPFGDSRLGLDLAAKAISPPHAYERVRPNAIARVSRRLKDAVWGHGVQIFITVEDSTIMRFPVSSNGTTTCALSWQPPPKLSTRAKAIKTKGDVSEVEIWKLLPTPEAPDIVSTTLKSLDFDTLSYSSLPVRGELLGVLDFTAELNSTTVEFACPGEEEESLVVELRCQRVACHISFLQLDTTPIAAVELVERKTTSMK